MHVGVLPTIAVPGLVSGSGIPTAAIVGLVNAVLLLVFFALLISIAVSLRRIRRGLARLEDRLDREDHATHRNGAGG